MSRLLTPEERDRARALANALAATIATGSVAAVGAVSALAAEQTRQQAELRAIQAMERDAAVAGAASATESAIALARAVTHPFVVPQPRPTRTVIDPGAIARASRPGVARPGPAPTASGRSTRTGSASAQRAPAPLVPSTGS